MQPHQFFEGKKEEERCKTHVESNNLCLELCFKILNRSKWRRCEWMSKVVY